MVEKFEGGITILVPTPHIAFVNFKVGGGEILVKGDPLPPKGNPASAY